MFYTFAVIVRALHTNLKQQLYNFCFITRSKQKCPHIFNKFLYIVIKTFSICTIFIESYRWLYRPRYCSTVFTRCWQEMWPSYWEVITTIPRQPGPEEELWGGGWALFPLCWGHASHRCSSSLVFYSFYSIGRSSRLFMIKVIVCVKHILYISNIFDFSW